jgi:hypothetical protein
LHPWDASKIPADGNSGDPEIQYLRNEYGVLELENIPINGVRSEGTIEAKWFSRVSTAGLGPPTLGI